MGTRRGLYRGSKPVVNRPNGNSADSPSVSRFASLRLVQQRQAVRQSVPDSGLGLLPGRQISGPPASGEAWPSRLAGARTESANPRALCVRPTTTRPTGCKTAQRAALALSARTRLDRQTRLLRGCEATRRSGEHDRRPGWGRYSGSAVGTWRSGIARAPRLRSLHRVLPRRRAIARACQVSVAPAANRHLTGRRRRGGVPAVPA